VVPKLSIEFDGDHLRRGAFGASDDRDNTCRRVLAWIVQSGNALALVMAIPIVTITLNNPLTIRSTTWSNSSSFVFALFSAQYVCSFSMPRLNRSGSATMKFRY
jgi:hypothetical protein